MNMKSNNKYSKNKIVENREESIVVIIPAFNEEKNIKNVIRKCKEYIQKIIVIDDGSSDNTSQIAKNEDTIVIINRENLGKTDSLKKGFRKGTDESADIFLLLDADGQHNPDEIPLFLEKIHEGYDLVIGARKFRPELMPKIRILANAVSSYLVSLICGVKIKDSQSGYRALTREVVEEITITSSRFQADTEMIVKAAKHGFKVGFVPIETIYHPEAKSKVHQFIDPLRFIFLITRLAFYKKTKK